MEPMAGVSGQRRSNAKMALSMKPFPKKNGEFRGFNFHSLVEHGIFNLEYSLMISESSVQFDFIEFEYDTPLVSGGVVAEIFPPQVNIGEETEFRCFYAPTVCK